MAYGTNDAAITTNDLIKKFEPTLVSRLEETDAFGAFFREVPKPAGIEKTVNYEIDSTANEAERQAPLAHRIGKKREGYEIEVIIKDKIRESWPISWEKIRKGRIDEPGAAVEGVVMALARARAKILGDYLLTGSLTGANNDPVDPAAAATGETPNWWNTNDTIAPPAYGANTFSVGHDHVETGITAMTLDRIRVYMEAILQHGYGAQGLVMLLQSAQEKTLLSLGNAAQQNQTAGVKLRDEFQSAGRASGMNGLFGLEVIVAEWAPPGVVGMWDARLPSLAPYGGAVKVVEQAPVSDTEDDKDIQATWFEAYEQFGAGILHKGAGYTAFVA